MKKSNFLFGRPSFYKMGFLSFLLTLLFVAGTQTNMKAQTTHVSSNSIANNAIEKELYQIPSGNFVSVNVAKQRLESALSSLKSQLEQYPVGSASYNAVYVRYKYYSEILRNLNNGKGVAESIALSIGVIINSGNSDVQHTPDSTTVDVALAEKNSAISLLR